MDKTSSRLLLLFMVLLFGYGYYSCYLDYAFKENQLKVLTAIGDDRVALKKAIEDDRVSCRCIKKEAK